MEKNFPRARPTLRRRRLRQAGERKGMTKRVGKPWGKRGGSLGEAGGKRGGSHKNHSGFYRSVGGKRVRPVWPCIILEGASEETVGLLGTGRAEGLGLEAQRASGSGMGPSRILPGLAFDLRSTDSATTAATAMTAVTPTTRRRHCDDCNGATATTVVTATARRQHGDDCNGAAAPPRLSRLRRRWLLQQRR